MRSVVILDLDGTLADTLPDIRAALNRSLALLSLPPVTAEECRLMVGRGARNLTRLALRGREDLWDRLYDLYRADYSANLACLTRPYPGIADMLSSLAEAGLRLCVISNKDREDVLRVLEHCFPGFPFAVAEGRQPGVPLKPDAAPGLKCLSSLGAGPRDAVVVGDSDVDVAFARALGSPSVGCAWGFRGEEELRRAGCTLLSRTPAQAVSDILSLTC
ncbi:MAG: HAD family hydrolase [Clostridia bacterium]|nr:HAD family hydrolase [Clostridia bacterium]